MLKENLILLRSLHGYTMETVAEKIGISRQAYAKWENGDTVPDVLKCAALAELYGTTVDALLTDVDRSDAGSVLPPPKGKNIWGSFTLNDRGQIVIPKAVRERFSLHEGDRLIVLSDDSEGIALIPSSYFEKHLQTIRELAAQDNPNP